MSGLIDFIYFALKPQKAIDRINEQRHMITNQKAAITEQARYAKLNAKLTGESKQDEYDRAADEFNRFF